MGRYVLLVDMSGSMTCYLEDLKEELKEDYLDWLMERESDTRNHVALISFNADVHVLSHYTTNVDTLKTLVDGLAAGGLTAYDDAMLVGLVLEWIRPDELHVWSDHHDNCSNASRAAWSDLASALGVEVVLNTPPDYWGAGCTTPQEWQISLAQEAFVVSEAVTWTMAVAAAEKIAESVPRARFIKNPEDLLKLKPVKKKK